MNTAGTPIDPRAPMELHWGLPDVRAHFVYMHFAELQHLKPNQSRVFDIALYGKSWYDAVSPLYLQSGTVYTRTSTEQKNSTYSLIKLENSTLPPLLNAIEVYTSIDFTEPETEQDDGIYIYVFFGFYIVDGYLSS